MFRNVTFNGQLEIDLVILESKHRRSNFSVPNFNVSVYTESIDSFSGVSNEKKKCVR